MLSEIKGDGKWLDNKSNESLIDIFASILSVESCGRQLKEFDRCSPIFESLVGVGESYWQETRVDSFMNDISPVDVPDFDHSVVRKCNEVEGFDGKSINKGSGIVFDRLFYVKRGPRRMMLKGNHLHYAISHLCIVDRSDIDNRPLIYLREKKVLYSNNGQDWRYLRKRDNKMGSVADISSIVKRHMHYYLCRQYEWRFLIGDNESPRLSFVINPSSAKKLFRDRDRRRGEKRLRPLIHKVSQHKRTKNKDDPREVIEVLGYLRGCYKFSLWGYQCEIIPSSYDLKRMAMDNSKVAKKIIAERAYYESIKGNS